MPSIFIISTFKYPVSKTSPARWVSLEWAVTLTILKSQFTVTINRSTENYQEWGWALWGLGQFNNTSHCIINDERILICKCRCSQKHPLEEPDPLINIFPWFGIVLLLYFPIADLTTVRSAFRSSAGIFNKQFFGTKSRLLGLGA